MEIKLNTEKIYDVLVSFYELSGIRIVVFDADGTELMSYPQKRCAFCKDARRVGAINELCNKSDKQGCEQCKKTGELYMYTCHAGLVEAVTPIIHEGNLLGYMMFGAVTDIKEKSELRERIEAFGNKHGLHLTDDGIKYKSRKQLIAAAKILEVCTEYILLKEMIAFENTNLIRSVKAYIKEHLSEDLRIDELCKVTGCGRTKLYKMFREECGVGIAHYITEKRLKAARKMLRSSDKTVSEISALCGFCDYNYFAKVYKKAYGISPRKDRKASDEL